MFRTLIAAALAAGLSAPAFADITVTDSYARSSTPAAGAAFLMIANEGDRADRLIAARSDAAARVELHTHLTEDGIVRMIHVEEGFDLPASGMIEMKRGGQHVMFMGLSEAWDQGDTVPLTLIFESGMELTLEVTVDNERMPGQGHHDH